MSSGVIVGYDGSDGAKAALRAAVEVARVYGEDLIIAFGYQVSRVAGEVSDYAAAVKEVAEARVAEAGQLTADQGIHVEGAVLEQDPAEGLIALAAERDARLIVVGTHGESLLKAALLGSTAYKLLHITDRPVLVVPSD
jgi:nucleotide-binding universal stress UspA family protein